MGIIVTIESLSSCNACGVICEILYFQPFSFSLNIEVIYLTFF